MFQLVYAQSEDVAVAVNTGAWHAITSANIVVQFTLLILVMMSVISWAIMIKKRSQFREAQEADEAFEEAFWKASSLDEIFESISDHPKSLLARIFRSGYMELRKLADSHLAKSQGEELAPQLRGMDNLERALKKAIDQEISKMESFLSFLGTTGSTGPFIGLFGTVWGIMGAFQKIGATGVASLAVVAPGIAEALIATGIGLFAAIPATVGFNFYVTQLKKREIDFSNFSSDFLNIAKRNFFEGD